MSKVTATSKDGRKMVVCFLDEEFPGRDPMTVGKAFLAHDSEGKKIDDEYWVEWEVQDD